MKIILSFVVLLALFADFGYSYPANQCCGGNYLETCSQNCPLTSTTTTTGVIQCEPGYTLQDGRCIRIVESVQCPPGSVLRGQTCFRETTIPPSCPPGTIFENGRCVRIFERTCPNGYYLQNGICVHSEVVPVSCPPGTYQRGNECIQVKCPPDHQLENGRCVRIATYPQPVQQIVMNPQPMQQIVTNPQPLQPIVTNPQLPCQYNYPTGLTQCPLTAPTITAITGTMQCEPGYSLQDGRCIRIVDNMHCPPGSVLRGNTCFRETTISPSCPPGTIFENGRCVQTVERICPYGHHLENGTCVYSEVVPVSCPYGTYQRGNECIQVKCPPDYQMENGACVRIATNTQQQCQYNCQAVNQKTVEIVECEEGYVRRGDHCEKITCPTPTSWNGQHCAHVSGGNITNILNHTNIVNNINNVTHDTNVNLNNVNNVYIYKGGEVVHVTNETRTISPPILPPPVQSPPPVQPPLLPRPEKCCTVQSPRLCQKQSGSRWRCFNRKYSRCGPFCTQPVIQLRPPMPMFRPPTLVMPPQPPIAPSCGATGCNRMDCSGCETGGYCAPSCYQYSCNEGCEYADQGSFCESHSGPGCDESDGYYY